jgi:hypothetical protein
MCAFASRTAGIIRTHRRDARKFAARDDAFQLRVFSNPARAIPTLIQLIDRYYADIVTPGSAFFNFQFFPPWYISGQDLIPDTMHTAVYRLRKVPLGLDIPPPPSTGLAMDDPGWDGTFMILRGWRTSSLNAFSVFSVESMTIARGGADFLVADSERQAFVGLQLANDDGFPVPGCVSMKENHFPVQAGAGAWATATNVLLAPLTYYRTGSVSIVDRNPVFPGYGGEATRVTELIVEITRYPEENRDMRAIQVLENKPIPLF